ncbi:helix-turn-helix transcriptional regulator [Arthrobacter sp. NPDC056727]|uniref:helix-turn-helix transcriptional regulator n=1 Tax=Arthrobacter sp. NPDC056727 TaxID=3345927 RepID=UPI00366A589D
MTLISPSVVEQHYGIPVAQLRRWRERGIGPEYFQFTPRTVCYAEDYLRDWLNDPGNAHLHAVTVTDARPVMPPAGRPPVPGDTPDNRRASSLLK